MSNVPTLRVAIHCEGDEIGSAVLTAADPSMGVATGQFEPASSYDRSKHALVIDGDENPSRSSQFSMTAKDGKAINIAGIGIHDFADAIGEIEVHVCMESAEQFESLFPGAAEAEREWYESQR